MYPANQFIFARLLLSDAFVTAYPIAELAVTFYNDLPQEKCSSRSLCSHIFILGFTTVNYLVERMGDTTMKYFSGYTFGLLNIQFLLVSFGKIWTKK